jgi:hypothetical protein
MDVTSGVEMTHLKSQAFFTDICRTHPVCMQTPSKFMLSSIFISFSFSFFMHFDIKIFNFFLRISHAN